MRSLKIYIGNNDHQLAQLNVRSVDARKAFFRDVISRAFVDFRKNQRPGEADRLGNTRSGKSKRRYHRLGFDDGDISMTLLIDIGRFLGFRRAPTSDSWQYAGDAYLPLTWDLVLHQASMMKWVGLWI